MSHTFPNLQPHPTLTPNPTFQPQPIPLPLTPMSQTQANTTPNNNDRHTLPNPPLQFIPHPTHPFPHHLPNTQSHHPRHHNHTPDYTQLTALPHNPPPLTHENDIHSQDLTTSNDESNNSNSTQNPNKSDSKKPTNHTIVASPFANQTHSSLYNAPPIHIAPQLHHPFGANHVTDVKNGNIHKGLYYGIMPSPFMPHLSNATHTYDTHPSNEDKNGNGPGNETKNVGWQFAVLPQQIPNVAPMFGHPAYLPNDSYLRRANYGEQTMVDVPHAATATQLSEDCEANTTPKNGPSISMLISNTNNGNNNITPLNIEHGLNTNSNNESMSSPSKSDSIKDSKRDTSHSHKKKRKRKHRDHKRDRKDKRKHRNSKEDTKTKYVSIRGRATGNDNEQSVKGGAGNGYRMVLDEPVNKNMLSCHQCKNKKTLDRIIVCGHVYRINNTVKTCTKKYCKSCLLRFYLEAPPTDNQDPTWSSWKCPCCRYICCCAWCRKKKAKRLESVSNAIRAEAHRLTPAISLARKLVSESRVNNGVSVSHVTKHTSKKRMNRSHGSDLPPRI